MIIIFVVGLVCGIYICTQLEKSIEINNEIQN